jgi:hypothetical protein
VSKTFGVGIVGAGTVVKAHAAELVEPREEAGRELAGSHGVESGAQAERRERDQ